MEPNNAAAIIEAIQSLSTPQVRTVKRGSRDEVDFVLIPKGMTALNVKRLMDEYLPAPERRKGTAHLTSLESFNNHVLRFKDGDSVIFANPDPASPSLTAVLDYHVGGGGTPRFGQHRGVYQFPLSDEWKAWLHVHDKPMDQAQFAAFMEDRIADLIDPKEAKANATAFSAQIGVEFASPARMMDLSRGLAIHVESKVNAHVNLSSGEGQISYQENHNDPSTLQPIKVPGAILLQIPVFRGDAPYQIAVRLRYKVQGGKVIWRFALYRTDRAFDDAFKLACTATTTATGLPVLYGTPE
jgi:uncharacterized protein YfdQ (DUF2303 family)